MTEIEVEDLAARVEARFEAVSRLAPRDEIASRYELCEDTATLLTEHAPMMVFAQGLSEAQALARCRQGLLADASVFSDAEAGWIATRLAELLGWAPPAA